jgi:asparagine synthetase A
MKRFPTLLILTALLALTGCGKENESGKSNKNGICTSYLNGVCNAYASNYNVGVSGDINLNNVVSQIPCEMSQYGYNVTRTQQNIQVTTASRTTPGQSYLGVTSLGDIAIIIGNGSTTTQMTMFLCSGAGSYGGQVGAGVTQALLGEYTTMGCPIKTITAANYGASSFRSPVYGRGTTGQKFSFCQ